MQAVSIGEGGKVVEQEVYLFIVRQAVNGGAGRASRGRDISPISVEYHPCIRAVYCPPTKLKPFVIGTFGRAEVDIARADTVIIVGLLEDYVYIKGILFASGGGEVIFVDFSDGAGIVEANRISPHVAEGTYPRTGLLECTAPATAPPAPDSSNSGPIAKVTVSTMLRCQLSQLAWSKVFGAYHRFPLIKISIPCGSRD